MKVVIITILIALTSSAVADLGFYNFLKGKRYVIHSNILDHKQINGIQVLFTDSRISFVGCNNNFASYALKATGEFSMIGPWASTKKACKIDFDNELRELFSNTTKISELKSGSVEFLKDTQVLLTFNQKKAVQPISELANSALLAQNFVIAQTALNNSNIMGIEVRFTRASLFFQACNYNFAPYSSPAVNKFNVKQGQWDYTQIFCEIDFDSSIRQLFTKSKAFKTQQNGSISFYDEKSQFTIRLNPKQQAQPLQLKGAFTITFNLMSISQINGVIANFSNNRISFRQCNTNNAKYTTGVNFSFKIASDWAGTKMFCSNNYDSKIIQLFDNAVRYNSKENRIALFDKNSKKLLQLTQNQ